MDFRITLEVRTHGDSDCLEVRRWLREQLTAFALVRVYSVDPVLQGEELFANATEEERNPPPQLACPMCGEFDGCDCWTD